MTVTLPRARAAGLRLTGRPRRLARAGHVVAAAAWLGLSVAMTTIALLGLTATDPAVAATGYRLMSMIGTRVIAAAAIATVLTGLLLSATTPWGLVRFRWVVTKSMISLIVIISAVWLTNRWVEAAAGAALGPTGPEPAAWLTVAGAATHLLLLSAATVISVDKPWGRTRRRPR